MTEADRGAEFARLVAENRRYTESFDRSALTAAPLSRLVIVACMDARLDVEETLGLRTGAALFNLLGCCGLGTRTSSATRAAS